MANIERLRQYRESKKEIQHLEKLDDLTGIYVGNEPTQYFPKLKDEDGRPMKGADGKAMRAELPAGWIHTLSEYGTAKPIKIVLPVKRELEDLEAYRVEGYGYDIKGSGGLYFIEKEGYLELDDMA